MTITRLRQKSLQESDFKIIKNRLNRVNKVSQYEEKRLKNIADNKAMLEKIMCDLKGWKPGGEVRTTNNTPHKVSRPSVQSRVRRSVPSRLESNAVIRRNPGRAARPCNLIDETSCRVSNWDRNDLFNSGGELSSSSDDADDEIRLYDSDEEEENYYWQPEPVDRIHRTERYYKEINEITEDDIAAVADRTSEKVYNTVLGTTCHQCRQKTIDTKTICRNKECAGVRGQFCGPCLKNRYGEDARETLRDDKWICPPCRGTCNCSFCRRKAGRGATGILIHLARENGYSDVAAYLKSKNGRNL